MMRTPPNTPVARLLAWLPLPAEADFGEEAFRHHRSLLSVTLRLDDRSTSLRVLDRFPTSRCTTKTSVPALIEELYTFLRQADSRELNDIFRQPRRRPQGRRQGKEKALIERIDSFQTHVVPRDRRQSDAWLRQAEATYLLAQEDDRGRRVRAADRKPGL